MGKVEDNDFQIDKNNLDAEWLRQSNLYNKYAAKAADARRDFDECKNVLEVVKAEVSLSIRQSPEHHGISKVTEAVINQTVEIQGAVKDAQNDVVIARYQHEICSAAVNALDHKKKALENLVTLFMADYFSSPRAKKEEAGKMEEVERREIRGRGKDKRKTS